MSPQGYQSALKPGEAPRDNHSLLGWASGPPWGWRLLPTTAENPYDKR